MEGTQDNHGSQIPALVEGDRTKPATKEKSQVVGSITQRGNWVMWQGSGDYRSVGVFFASLKRWWLSSDLNDQKQSAMQRSGKSIPSRGNSWCGGPEMGTRLAYLRRPVSLRCSGWQEGWNKVRLEREYARWCRSLDFILSGMEAIWRLKQRNDIFDMQISLADLWAREEAVTREWPLWQSRDRGGSLDSRHSTGNGGEVSLFGLYFGCRLDGTYR